jgi:hypothetical protein
MWTIRNFGRAIGFGTIALVLCGPAMARTDLLTGASPVDDVRAGGAPATATAINNMNTTNMPDNSPAGAATPLAAELASINQPHLIARQSRVQFFREMFALPLAVPRGMPSAAGQSGGADAPIGGAARLTKSAPISIQQAAIESLQNRVAARQPPNPLMPLGSLATAFHLISNGVAKIMIHNLDAGHLPVYGEDGAVIGTRDAITGELTAGRERPRGKGQVWNNQG